MPELKVQVDLPASPDRVWSVLTDFSAYSEWNPYQAIKGVAELGELLTISSCGLDGREFPISHAVVRRIEPNAAMELRSGLPLWFVSTRFFDLAPADSGTRLSHGVRFSGIWALWRFSRTHMAERLKPFYDAFGIALTERLVGRRPNMANSSNRHRRRAEISKQKRAAR